MPTELNLEIRCEKNPDGTYNGVTYQDGEPLADFSVRRASCEEVRGLYVRVAAEYPEDVVVKVVGGCTGCVAGERLEEAVEGARRARSAIVASWRSVAESSTLSWGLPAEAVAARYPFISDGLWRLRRKVTRELPLLIYLNRESPPTQAAVAIPFREDGENPYSCRLLALPGPSAEQLRLLSEFSQAVWFLMGNGVLPPPQQGDALMRGLLALTGSSLLEL